jgi:uncharacterized protein YkwD
MSVKPLSAFWKKYTLFLLSLAFMLTVSAVQGQTPNSPIHVSSVNLPYLEYLVKAQVDSVRRSKGLSPLVSDSILYLAAKDQAQYLQDKAGISHYQKSNKKKTPQNRAELYGAVNYLTGENVLSYPLEKTYIATARRMVKGWVNSPGHYRNIVHNAYQVTGVALVPHQKNGNFIAVQVFAKVLWRYTFQTNRSLFPYDTLTGTQETPVQVRYAIPGKKEKLPWKLKPLNYQKSQKTFVWKSVIKHRLRMQPSYAKDALFMYSRTPKVLLKAMKRRRDGLAVEMIDYEPYHCGNPAYYTALSRRNGNSSVNGQVLAPVYKKELLSDLKGQKIAFKALKKKELKDLRSRQRSLWFSFSAETRKEKHSLRSEKQTVRRRKWNPFQTVVPVGKWSQADSGSYLAPNFLIIRRNRIVAPLYFTDVCGDLSFIDTLQTRTYFVPPRFQIQEEKHSFDFAIPFVRNSTLPDSTTMRAIADTLLNYQIDSISIRAFASIEGLNALNEQLYLSRGNAIIEYIKRYVTNRTNIEIKTGENWQLFYKQVKESEATHWKKLSKEQIKQELQKLDVLNEWENRLAEQRKAQVHIEAHVSVEDTLKYVYKTTQLQTPQQATLRQNYYYQHLNTHPQLSDSICQAKYPAKKEYSQLIANQLTFDYQQHHSDWNKYDLYQHWQSLRKALQIKGRLPEIRYYAVFFIIRNWDFVKSQGYDTKQVFKMIEEVAKDKRYTARETRLKVVYYLKALPHSLHAQDMDMKEWNVGVRTVYNYYHNKPEIMKDAERALSLGNFFLEIQAEDLAVKIFDDYLNKTGYDEAIYIQFLKLAFEHPDYQKNRHYTRLLINAKQTLPREKWCDLFVGPCRISFQMFDDEELRSLYCESCSELGNDFTRKINLPEQSSPK